MTALTCEQLISAIKPYIFFSNRGVTDYERGMAEGRRDLALLLIRRIKKDNPAIATEIVAQAWEYNPHETQKKGD